jgi:hypothetical protein
MQLLRESSQPPVETPQPAEKAGDARFRLPTIMPLTRRMQCCGCGLIRSVCFEVDECSIQPALGFVEIPNLLLGSILAEDHRTILVAVSRDPNFSSLWNPSSLVSSSDHV